MKDPQHPDISCQTSLALVDRERHCSQIHLISHKILQLQTEFNKPDLSVFKLLTG